MAYLEKCDSPEKSRKVTLYVLSRRNAFCDSECNFIDTLYHSLCVGFFAFGYGLMSCLLSWDFRDSYHRPKNSITERTSPSTFAAFENSKFGALGDHERMNINQHRQLFYKGMWV